MKRFHTILILVKSPINTISLYFFFISGFQAGHPAGGAPLHMCFSPQAAALAAVTNPAMQVIMDFFFCQIAMISS